MKVTFIKSLSTIPYDELYPVAKDEHRGKVSRVNGSEGKNTLMIVLPCGHSSIIDGWNIIDLDTEHPTATPSIFCKGNDGRDCWHGYLTNGRLTSI